jgi:vacuolar-type H+-ATPase subunit E/Vma4
MIKKMIPDCEKEFAEHMKKETGRDYKTKLTIMAEKFLTNEEGAECGGIIMYAHGNRIVVPNTLQDRMNLVFELALPQIRQMLFKA